MSSLTHSSSPHQLVALKKSVYNSKKRKKYFSGSACQVMNGNTSHYDENFNELEKGSNALHSEFERWLSQLHNITRGPEESVSFTEKLLHGDCETQFDDLDILSLFVPQKKNHSCLVSSEGLKKKEKRSSKLLSESSGSVFSKKAITLESKVLLESKKTNECFSNNLPGGEGGKKEATNLCLMSSSRQADASSTTEPLLCKPLMDENHMYSLDDSSSLMKSIEKAPFSPGASSYVSSREIEPCSTLVCKSQTSLEKPLDQSKKPCSPQQVSTLSLDEMSSVVSSPVLEAKFNASDHPKSGNIESEMLSWVKFSESNSHLLSSFSELSPEQLANVLLETVCSPQKTVSRPSSPKTFHTFPPTNESPPPTDSSVAHSSSLSTDMLSLGDSLTPVNNCFSSFSVSSDYSTPLVSHEQTLSSSSSSSSSPPLLVPTGETQSLDSVMLCLEHPKKVFIPMVSCSENHSLAPSCVKVSKHPQEGSLDPFLDVFHTSSPKMSPLNSFSSLVHKPPYSVSLKTSLDTPLEPFSRLRSPEEGSSTSPLTTLRSSEDTRHTRREHQAHALPSLSFLPPHLVSPVSSSSTSSSGSLVSSECGRLELKEPVAQTALDIGLQHPPSTLQKMVMESQGFCPETSKSSVSNGQDTRTSFSDSNSYPIVSRHYFPLFQHDTTLLDSPTFRMKRSMSSCNVSNDWLDEGFQGEDGLWYKRPDVDDRCLQELCDLVELKKREQNSRLSVEYEGGVSFPLGEGGRELLRACLNVKGCKGRSLQGASVPALLKLAYDWGLWNVAIRIKIERVTGELCPKHEAFVRFKAMQSHLRKYVKREQMHTERDRAGHITDIRFEEMKYLTLGKEGREKLRSQLRRLHDQNASCMDALLERYGFKYSELRNATVPQLLKIAHICCMWHEVIDACKTQEAKKDFKGGKKVEKSVSAPLLSLNSIPSKSLDYVFLSHIPPHGTHPEGYRMSFPESSFVPSSVANKSQGVIAEVNTSCSSTQSSVLSQGYKSKEVITSPYSVETSPRIVQGFFCSPPSSAGLPSSNVSFNGHGTSRDNKNPYRLAF